MPQPSELNPLNPLVDLRHGVDLVPVERIEMLVSRYGAQFISRLLTLQEQRDCGLSPNLSFQTLHTAAIASIAARIATKEAVSKALGIGICGLGYNAGARWKEIELIRRPQEAPELKLHGAAQRQAEAQGITDWRVSITHDGVFALSSVIGLIRSDYKGEAVSKG